MVSNPPSTLPHPPPPPGMIWCTAFNACEYTAVHTFGQWPFSPLHISLYIMCVLYVVRMEWMLLFFPADFWCWLSRRNHQCINSLSTDWSFFTCPQNICLQFFRGRRKDIWKQLARIFCKFMACLILVPEFVQVRNVWILFSLALSWSW